MSTATEQVISPEVINEAMSYSEYREMIDERLDSGKTTGSNHSDEMIHYTKMNVRRMSRLDNQIELSESLKEALSSVEQDWVWLVLTEAWCGRMFLHWQKWLIKRKILSLGLFSEISI